VQDSWKATRRLTLELGLRLTHFQPWADRLGFGYSVFQPADYNANCTAIEYCGFEWHSKDSAGPDRLDSRRVRCSISPALALHSICRAKARRFSAAAGAVTTITPASSPAGLDVPAAK
jgi:hypothetical protein